MTRNRIINCAVPCLLVLLAVFSVPVASAGEAPQNRDNLKEPIPLIARATKPNPNGHPLDPALELARYGREKINKTIKDYTCTLVKRERIDGELQGYEYAFAKIRNSEALGGEVIKPFAVYLHFLKPSSIRGREVIYVKGRNDNKLVAHEGGRAGAFLPTVWLDPDSMLATKGQRYRIYDLGLKNLVDKLIKEAERDKAAGRKQCEVTFREGAKINGRACTLMEIKSPKADPSRKPDYHLTQVFFDDELQLPIRYVNYGYPVKDGAKPPVIEEYTLLNLKLNVGLKDKDFDHENEDYNF